MTKVPSPTHDRTGGETHVRASEFEATVTYSVGLAQDGRDRVMVAGVVRQGWLPPQGAAIDVWDGDVRLGTAVLASGAMLDAKSPNVGFALAGIEASVLRPGVILRSAGAPIRESNTASA